MPSKRSIKNFNPLSSWPLTLRQYFGNCSFTPGEAMDSIHGPWTRTIPVGHNSDGTSQRTGQFPVPCGNHGKQHLKCHCLYWWSPAALHNPPGAHWAAGCTPSPSQHGITINLPKCKFCSKEVAYLRFCLTYLGCHWKEGADFSVNMCLFYSSFRGCGVTSSLNKRSMTYQVLYWRYKWNDRCVCRLLLSIKN